MFGEPGAVSRARIGATAALAAGTLLLALTPVGAQAAPITEHVPSADDRHTLAGGCFALRSLQTGDYVVKSGGTYSATETLPAAAEPFRMQATDLGSYLFYGPGEDFMARNASTNGTTAAGAPSDDADWTVSEDGGDFRLRVVGRGLAVGANDALVTVNGDGGAAGLFDFEPADGCADYPEVEVNVEGPLPASYSANSVVTGTVETHMHGMAFEFLGTKVHCGRPWHRFGAPSALVDCPDHGDTNNPETEGCAAVLENALSGTMCHDTGGWPTFAGWPRHNHYTHEQSYYRWLERAWRGGMRVYVNLMVENRVLCELYPLTPQPSVANCNEMDSVRRQIARIHELEDYIDAQWGGPGKGWFRIVEDPVTARAVINDGKLAIVKGMEVSEPFGCILNSLTNTSQCTEAELDAGIDEMENRGIRQFEIVNKFDNGLTGVAGDSGTTGVVTNNGNFLSTQGYWDYEHCDEPEDHDHSPAGPPDFPGSNDDALIGAGLEIYNVTPLPPIPVYGPGPHCNQRGLSALGAHAIDRFIDEGLIFDPDHMSAIARDQALDLVEAAGYPGVMTSHSWSTDDSYRRVAAIGGLQGPSAKGPAEFVVKWRKLRAYPDLGPGPFGIGYGADMNGFASQGGPPPAEGRISYPFESPIDPTASVCPQQSGEFTFDYNVHGTAHYGLYPDWTEAVRVAAGDDGAEIVDDLGNAAEAYLQMWERAEGVNGAGGGAPGAGVPSGSSTTCEDEGSGGGGGGGGGGQGAGSSSGSQGGSDKVCAKRRVKSNKPRPKGKRKKKGKLCGRLR